MMWWLSGTVFLFTWCFTQFAQDGQALLDREKQAFVGSKSAAWYPPNLLKSVDQLREKAQAGAKAGDERKAQAFIQQARWLLPDPQVKLPDHVSRVLGSLKFKHDGYLFATVFAPDGQTLITAGQDGTVRHWNLANGQLKTLWDLGKPLAALAVSPDEKWLAVAEGWRFSPNLDASQFAAQDQHVIHLYDLKAGTHVKQLSGHGKNPILAVAFSPDSRKLASGCQIGLGGNDGIKLWDIASGKEERPPMVPYSVPALLWSKSGDRIYSAQSNNSISVVDVARGTIERSTRESAKIHCLALSPDGETLALAGEINDGSTGTYLIRLYSTKSWSAGNLSAHQAPILALVYQRDGKALVSASAKPEAAVRVWNMTDKTQTAQFQGHGNDVLAVALRPDGSAIASISLDQTIRLWHVGAARPSRIVGKHQGAVWGVALSPAGKQALSFSADRTAIIWDLATGQALQRYAEHQAPVTAGAFRADGGQVATGGGDQTIRVWNPATGKTEFTLAGHTGIITSLAYSPDGKRLYSGSADRTVKAWDLASRKVLYSLPQHRGVVTSVATNLDGQWLVSGGADHIVRLWQASDGKELKAFVGHTAAVTALMFSPGGQLLASVGADGRTILWDTQSGAALRTMSGHVGQLMAVAFSANLKYLVTGGADEVAKVWNVASGTEMRALQGHSDWVTAAVFLPDNESVLTASVDGTLRIWEEDQETEFPNYGHSQPVRCLAMSPQGDRLASGGEDGLIYVWDTRSGNDMARLTGHLGGITALAFSHDGKWLLAGDQRHDIRLWEVATGKEVSSVTAGGTPAKLGFLSKDLGIVAWTGNAEIFLWPLNESSPPTIKADGKTSFIGSDQHPNALSLAGNYLLLGTIDGNAKAWRVNDKLREESAGTIPCFNEAIYGQSLNAQGTRLFCLNQESQFKWIDVATKKSLHTWKGRPQRPTCFAVHPQRDLVLVGFESQEVVLWNALTGQELRSWKFRGPVTDLILAPESKTGFAGGQNGVIYQLDLP